MHADNFENSLRAFTRRQPFKPFCVELMSGNRFVIDHPEALAMRGPVAVYISADGRYALFDSHSVSQMTEVFERNGGKKRR